MLRSAAITGRLIDLRLERDGNMNAGQRDAPHSADRCSSRSFLGRIYMYVYTLSPHFVYFVPKCVDHRNRNRTGTGPVPVPVAGGTGQVSSWSCLFFNFMIYCRSPLSPWSCASKMNDGCYVEIYNTDATSIIILSPVLTETYSLLRRIP